MTGKFFKILLTIIAFDGHHAIVKIVWLWLSHVLNFNNVLIVWLKLWGCQLRLVYVKITKGPSKVLGSGPDSSLEKWFWPLTKWLKTLDMFSFCWKDARALYMLFMPSFHQTHLRCHGVHL